MPSSFRIWANSLGSAWRGSDIMRLKASQPVSVKNSLGEGCRSNRISPLSRRLWPAGGTFGSPAVGPVLRIRTKNPSAAAGSEARYSSNSRRIYARSAASKSPCAACSAHCVVGVGSRFICRGYLHIDLGLRNKRRNCSRRYLFISCAA